MNKDQEETLSRIAETIEASEHPNVEHLNKLPTLNTVNGADLYGEPVKPLEWLIEGWMPVGCVTSLYGDGGVGKSLLALQVGAAIATGNKIFGLDTKQARILAIFCEDDKEEVHRRQATINDCDGFQFTDLADLTWVSRCGEEDNLLATRKGDGSIERTGLFYAIRQLVTETGVRLIILDNIAHLYPGDENNRGEVTAFVNILNELALAIKGSVLLLGHTPKSEAEYSGSTGWNNAVRSRWFFSRPKGVQGDDEDADSDALIDHRILKKGKSNYGRMGEEINLVWHQGAFKPDFTVNGGSTNSMEAKMRHREIEIAFLKELDERNAQLRPVSASPHASKSYAPNVFVKASRFKDLKATKTEIIVAMERLFEGKKILGKGDVGNDPKHRHRLAGIVRNDDRKAVS